MFVIKCVGKNGLKKKIEMSNELTNQIGLWLCNCCLRIHVKACLYKKFNFVFSNHNTWLPVEKHTI